MDYFNEKVLEADFIITNPPFTKVNKWLQWLIANNKKYFVIRNPSPVTMLHKSVIYDTPDISRKNYIWNFLRPDGSLKGVRCFLESNFVNLHKIKVPVKLEVSEVPPKRYKWDTWQCYKRRIDGEKIWLSCGKVIPPNAKYVAINCLLACEDIEGMTKLYWTNGNFGPLENDTFPYSQIIYKSVIEKS